MITLEQINEFNEKENREDKMYIIMCYFYKKTKYSIQEVDGDPCLFQTNDLEEAKRQFEYFKYLHRDRLYKMKLEQAKAFEGEHDIWYEPIDEASTISKKEVSS